jgi:hypothetical protein
MFPAHNIPLIGSEGKCFSRTSARSTNALKSCRGRVTIVASGITFGPHEPGCRETTSGLASVHSWLSPARTDQEQDMLIYLITNIVNGKLYVGQTKGGVAGRWKGHMKMARLPRPKQYIARAIAKYGEGSFKVSILHDNVPDMATLDALEKQEILARNLTDPAIGYNRDLGGRGKGRMTDEGRRAFSESRKGRYAGEANPFFGRKHSDEERERMRAWWAVGRTVPPEVVARRAASLKASGKNLGDKHWTRAKGFSPETLAKLSTAFTGERNHQFGKTGAEAAGYGRNPSEETRQKIAESKIGKPRPAHVIETLRQVSRERMSSPEAKRQVVEASKQWRESHPAEAAESVRRMTAAAVAKRWINIPDFNSIIAQYQQGATVLSLAKLAGVNPQTLKDRLQRAGVFVHRQPKGASGAKRQEEVRGAGE